MVHAYSGTPLRETIIIWNADGRSWVTRPNTEGRYLVDLLPAGFDPGRQGKMGRIDHGTGFPEESPVVLEKHFSEHALPAIANAMAQSLKDVKISVFRQVSM